MGIKKEQNQKVTLSLNSETYKEFQKYCEDNAIMLSKKVEIFMKKELEARGGGK